MLERITDFMSHPELILKYVSLGQPAILSKILAANLYM